MQPRKGIARLAQTENRVVRPRDFRDAYANPGVEFGRLARRGVLAKLAHGYYVLVPEEHRGEFWQPEVEGVALGIAVADYGQDAVALMGPTAARVLGAIPRALATATVAVPRERPALETTVGRIQFVTRKVERLDTQRTITEITTGWVTTAEQTVLDLADRPTLGGIAPTTAEEAIRALTPQCDPQLIARLAHAQHKIAAWQRFCWLVGLPAQPARQGVPTRGLRGTADPGDYGLVPTAA
jgi:predicted transcriptional regulator of viral defense system